MLHRICHQKRTPNFTSDNATKFTVAMCLISSPGSLSLKKMPLQFRLGQGSSRDSAGEAHTASGALAFGSPNFKLLPEPLFE